MLKQVQAPKDRMEIARVLVELAENAENNPMLQETLRKIKLPPPYDVLEYRKRENSKGFWARLPHTREHPSEGQLETRLAFSEIAYSLFGTKGAVEIPDGTRIARLNYLQGEIMRGMKAVSEDERAEKQKQKAMDRIVEAVAPSCP
ncbi:MAG: hypothetical protein Q7T55_22585 [Solirubrobacteraceae bacterium]|nr:hypothetical protein [Solirubrobacteraceae bacterium]